MHGSTFTVFGDEIVPWLEGVAMAPREGLQPAVFDNGGRRFVSMMVWRPIQPVAIPSRQTDAMMKVFSAVTGEVEAESIDDVFRDTDVLGETAGTVITAVTPLVRKGAEPFLPALTAAFDFCLEDLNTLVRAYVTTAGVHDARLISRLNVFPTVLFLLRDPFDEEAEQYSGLFSVHEGVNLGLSGATRELDENDAAKIATRLSRIQQGDPFQAAAEQFFRARCAYWVDGDYAATVSAAYTGGEVLLNSLLLLLEWEKGTPRQTIRPWFEEQGLVRRLRTYYHATLAGNWAPNDRNGPIGKFMGLAELRGRVVHAGYWPSEEEAQLALEIMDEVTEFVKLRLADKAGDHPRTALLLLGRPGLERLGAWRKVERFFEGVAGAEDPWIESFQAWLSSNPEPAA